MGIGTKIRTSLAVAIGLTLAACGSAASDGAEGGTSGAETDASAAEAEAPAVTKLDTLPASFRGYWDANSDEFACTDLSDGIMRVEENEILFYEASATPKEIRAVSDNEISVDVDMQMLEENEQDTYRMVVSDGGKKLSLQAKGFDPYTYRKCEGGIKEAVLMPSAYIGTWVGHLEQCKGAGERLLKVEPTRVTFMGSSGKLTKVEQKGPRAVELEDDSEPTPYGFVLGENDNSLTLVGPGHSGIPMKRCSR